MNAQVQLPNSTATANTILHTVCLNQGRVAVLPRQAIDPELLALAEDLAANEGGFFASQLGLCHAKLLAKGRVAGVLLLEREDGILGSGGLALRPHTPCLWKTALGIYAHLQRHSGQHPLDWNRLKPNAYPWMATILTPKFVGTATQQELLTVDSTLSALAFGVLEQIRKSTQHN